MGGDRIGAINKAQRGCVCGFLRKPVEEFIRVKVGCVRGFCTKGMGAG